MILVRLGRILWNGAAAILVAAAPVTSWPRARKAFATPSTCALTSCGCDHANGVTKQIRRLTGRKLQAEASVES